MSDKFSGSRDFPPVRLNHDDMEDRCIARCFFLVYSTFQLPSFAKDSQPIGEVGSFIQKMAKPLSDRELRPWTIDESLDKKIVDMGNDLDTTLNVTSPSKQGGAKGFSAIDKNPLEYVFYERTLYQATNPNATSTIHIQESGADSALGFENSSPENFELADDFSGDPTESTNQNLLVDEQIVTSDGIAELDIALMRALDDLNNTNKTFGNFNKLSGRKGLTSRGNSNDKGNLSSRSREAAGRPVKLHSSLKAVQYRPRTGPNVLNISCASSSTLIQRKVSEICINCILCVC